MEHGIFPFVFIFGSIQSFFKFCQNAAVLLQQHRRKFSIEILYRKCSASCITQPFCSSHNSSKCYSRGLLRVYNMNVASNNRTFVPSSSVPCKLHVRIITLSLRLHSVSQTDVFVSFFLTRMHIKVNKNSSSFCHEVETKLYIKYHLVSLHMNCFVETFKDLCGSIFKIWK